MEAQAQKIGPTGGLMAFPGGQLTFPPGALAHTVEITHQLLPGPAREPAHRFGPDGLTFARAVLQLDAPAALSFTERVVIATRVDHRWVRLPTTRADNTLTTSLTHFSDYGLVVESVAPATSTGTQVRHNGVTASLSESTAFLTLLAGPAVNVLTVESDTDLAGTVTFDGLSSQGVWYWSVRGTHDHGVTAAAGGIMAVPLPSGKRAMVTVQRSPGTHRVFRLEDCVTELNGLLDGNTCLLSGNLDESVDLAVPGMTLDCQEHTITPPTAAEGYGAIGVTLVEEPGMALVNCRIESYEYGVVSATPDLRITRNVIHANELGLNIIAKSRVTITDNTVSPHLPTPLLMGLGMLVTGGGSLNGEISRNTLTGLRHGVFLRGTHPGFTISNNNMTIDAQDPEGPPANGLAVWLDGISVGPRIESNTLRSVGWPVVLDLHGWLGDRLPVMIHNNIGLLPNAQSGAAKVHLLCEAALGEVAWEMSQDGRGNSWGHTLPPAFRIGDASSSLRNCMAKDSHPYCADDAWLRGEEPCVTSGPLAPTVTWPADGAISNQPILSVAGSVDDVGLVSVFANGAVVGTARGYPPQFHVTLASPLVDGSHLVAVTVTRDSDQATSPQSNAVRVTVDTIPPHPPVLTGPTEGGVHQGAHVSLTGTAEPGSLILVLLDSNQESTWVVDPAGDFEAALVPASGCGRHVLTAWAKDSAGNTSAPTEVQFALLPVLSLDAPTLTDPINDTCRNSPVTYLAGTMESIPAATLRMYVNGHVRGESDVSGSGFHAELPLPLGEGLHTAEAEFILCDGLMVSPRSDPVTVRVVTSSPPAPAVTATSVTGRLPATAVQGHAEAGHSVFAWEGTKPRPAEPVDVVRADGSFGPSIVHISITVEAFVNVQVMDCAGQVSPVVSVPAALDVVDPTPPLLGMVQEGARYESVTAVGVTLLEPGAVTVMEGQRTVAEATSLPSGTCVIDVPPQSLGHGSHTITAILIASSDGRLSPPSAPVGFLVDRTPPPPVVTEPETGASLEAPLAQVSGTARATRVTVSSGETAIGETNVRPDGTFTVVLAAALGPGAHHLLARAVREVDGVSLLSTPTRVMYQIASNTVSTPSIHVPAPMETVSAGSIIVGGMAERGAVVTVRVDGIDLTTATSGLDGWWVADFKLTAPGSHSVTAQAKLGDRVSAWSVTHGFAVTEPTPSGTTVSSPSGKVSLTVKDLGKSIIVADEGEEKQAAFDLKWRPMPSSPAHRLAFTVVTLIVNNKSTGLPHTSIRVAAQHQGEPNSDEESTIFVQFYGQNDAGQVPHRTTVLGVKARAETGYVMRSPASNCEELDDRTAATVFGGANLDDIRRDKKPLCYRRHDVTDELDLGSMVVSAGVVGSNEGVLSQLRRVKEDWDDLVARERWNLSATPWSLPQGWLSAALESPVSAQLLADLPGLPGDLVDLRTMRTLGVHGNLWRCRATEPVSECLFDSSHTAPSSLCQVRGCVPADPPEPAPVHDFSNCECVDWVDTGLTRPECSCDLGGDFPFCAGGRQTCHDVPVRVCARQECAILGYDSPPRICSATCPPLPWTSDGYVCVPRRDPPDCTASRPMDPNYRPEFFTSQDGLAVLRTRAERYEKYFVDRHIVDGQYLTAEVDPRIALESSGGRPVLRFHDYRNSVGVTGLVALARAYKFQVTQDAVDRSKLEDSLHALHFMMTVLSPQEGDPRGGFVIKINQEDDDCRPERGSIWSNAAFRRGGCPQLNGRQSDWPDYSVPMPVDAVEPYDLSDYSDEQRLGMCGLSESYVAWPRSVVAGWHDDEVRPEIVRAMFRELRPAGTAEVIDGKFRKSDLFGVQADLPSFQRVTRGDPTVPRVGSRTRQRFRVHTDASRDIFDYVFLGVAKGLDVLPETTGETTRDDEIRTLRVALGRAIGRFMGQLITNNYVTVDVDGIPTRLGRIMPPQSFFGHGNAPIEDPETWPYDVTQAAEGLNYLRICSRLVPNDVKVTHPLFGEDVAVRNICADQYQTLALRYLAPVMVDRFLWETQLLANAVSSPATEFRHAIGVVRSYRPFMVMTALESIIRQEESWPTLDSADIVVGCRRVIHAVYGLAAHTRNPMLDALYLASMGFHDEDPRLFDFEANQVGSSLVGRLAAVLGQYPDPEAVFWRPGLPEPIPSCGVQWAMLPGCRVGCMVLSLAKCPDYVNLFTKRFGAGDETEFAGAVWALGQNINPVPDGVVGARPYWLGQSHYDQDGVWRGERTWCGDETRGGFHEPQGYPFMLAYWYARAQRLLGAGGGNQ